LLPAKRKYERERFAACPNVLFCFGLAAASARLACAGGMTVTVA
jgi:hypothetical protein